MGSTTADSNMAVVATAARLDTMCLMRGDIPLVIAVLLCLSFRHVPDAESMIGSGEADVCQAPDTSGEVTPG
jgi:hypothetical protein